MNSQHLDSTSYPKIWYWVPVIIQRRSKAPPAFYIKIKKKMKTHLIREPSPNRLGDEYLKFEKNQKDETGFIPVSNF